MACTHCHIRSSRQHFVWSSSAAQNARRSHRPNSISNHQPGVAMSMPVMEALTSMTIKEVACHEEERPTVGLSGAAGAALPAGHPYAAIVLGGYAEYVSKADSSSAAGAAPAPGTPGPPAQGITRKEVMDAWLFDAAAGAWKAVEYGPGPVPVPRIAHQAVVVGQQLIMLGGWHPSGGPDQQFLSDIWALDLTTWQWTQLHPEGEPMPAISRFQAKLVGEHSIYIHHHRCSDHILVLELNHSTPRLKKVPVSGDVPSSRGLHSMTALPGKLLVYGGAAQDGRMLDDVYQLDLATHTWTRCTPPGPQPHPRCSQTAAALSDGRHVLFMGGAYYKHDQSGGRVLQALGDVFLYDAQDNQWVIPPAEDASLGSRLPAARNVAVMVPLPQQQAHDQGTGGTSLLLYGGWIPFVSTFNNTYVLSLKI